MATITERKRKGGSRYTAQIRIKRDGQIVHSEAETFDKRSMAIAWGKKREAELAIPGAIAAEGHRGLTVGQVLQWYLDDYNDQDQFGRSKLATLQALLRTPLADLRAMSLTPGDIIQHIRERRRTVSSSTALNDIIWLRTAFKRIRPTRNIPLNMDVIEDAAQVCKAEKLIGKSKERKRRPSLLELDSILEHIVRQKHGGRIEIPMIEIIAFAIFSTRRQDEICRIRFSDLDIEQSRVLVRDMKDPNGTSGNDVWVSLPPEALLMIQQRKRIDPNDEAERIFPYDPKSVSSAFTRTCKMTAIKDLRFHDLRHDGISRLFELGMDIPRVSMVSGHRSWAQLRRYTHLYELGIKDKYAGWRWLQK